MEKHPLEAQNAKYQDSEVEDGDKEKLVGSVQGEGEGSTNTPSTSTTFRIGGMTCGACVEVSR